MSVYMQAYMKLPWTGTDITFGSGFDVMSRQLKPSALEPFQPFRDNISPKIHTSSYSLETAEDVMHKIKEEVSATVPIEGAKIETSGGFLRKVKMSENSMYKVFRATVEGPPTRGRNGDFKLSEKALRILEGPDGPKRFVEQYGHYFVYACESKSSFAVACGFSSSDTAAMTQMKASLGGDIAEVASATRKIQAEYQQKGSNIQTAIDMELVGFDMHGLSVSTLEGASEAFNKFISESKPAPYMASLLHYSAVDSRIPSPAEQFKDLSQTVSLMLQRLYMLQCDVLSCTMERAKALSDTISKASLELLQVNPSDSNAMGEWSNQINGFAEDARRWKDRSQLLRDVTKLSNQDYVKTNEWNSSSDRTLWTQGIMIPGDPIWNSIASDVHLDERSWNPSWKARSQEQKFPLGTNDRLVIGWQVVSHWQDGTNGDWKWIRGKVKESEIEVAFRTESWRGGSWTVRVWTVDRALYIDA